MNDTTQESSTILAPVVERALQMIPPAERGEPVLPPADAEGMIKVSEATSALAFLYEKARNAIDYKDDHLIRRAAIERILRRLLGFKTDSREVAEALLKEIIEARYLPNNSVPISQIDEVNRILQKYFLLLAQLNVSQPNDPTQPTVYGFLVEIASCEIEKCLVSQKKQDALAWLMYQELLDSITLEMEEYGPETRKLQLFLAVQHTFQRPDPAALKYSLFVTYHPTWLHPTDSALKDTALHLHETVDKINYQLDLPIWRLLARRIRGFAPPFVILEEILEYIHHPANLETAVEVTCRKAYQNLRSKLGRTISRSVIYIFITKMVLALIIEIPLDILIEGRVSPIPLAVNLTFPPILLFLLGSTARAPGKANTQLIKLRLGRIVYHGTPLLDQEQIAFAASTTTKRSTFEIFFYTLYLFGFVASFGAISFTLMKLHFNLVSATIFLFFLCVVGFFAYIIRRSTQHLNAIQPKQSTLSALTDFFSLPILRTGNWLSAGLSQLNIFIFIFDFIIETPFKTILEIGEAWLVFVREKKEELAG